MSNKQDIGKYKGNQLSLINSLFQLLFKVSWTCFQWNFLNYSVNVASKIFKYSFAFERHFKV